MPSASTSGRPPALEPVLAWRRVRFTLIACVLPILLMMPGWQASYAVLALRWIFVGLVVLLAFGIFERWPARLPRRLARWALQILAVACAVPIATWIAYRVTTAGDPTPFWKDGLRLAGFASMTFLGLLLAPWIAISALLRQIRGEAEKQALAFQLERSELERRAVDARLKLLQAQVEPHFLFNTLANVRELVDSGSAQASTVLGSLIGYLRAAMPRLHEAAATVADEIELVRAYLEIMHMRMPDRMQYVLHADDATLALQCPPMTLLTLVENAVRHGIDPSETGGRIEVRVTKRANRCHAQVVDSGVGLRPANARLGTGLSTLRERLSLTFAGDAQLRLTPIVPRGACAEVEFPAREMPA